MDIETPMNIESIMKTKSNDYTLIQTVSQNFEIMRMDYKSDVHVRYNEDAPSELYIDEEDLSSDFGSLDNLTIDCLCCRKEELYISKFNIMNWVNSKDGFERVNIEFYCPDCRLEYRLNDNWCKLD